MFIKIHPNPNYSINNPKTNEKKRERRDGGDKKRQTGVRKGEKEVNFPPILVTC